GAGDATGRTPRGRRGGRAPQGGGGLGGRRRSAVSVGARVGAALLGGACSSSGGAAPPRQVPDGDAGRGAELIAQFGCGSCHVIPGIREADGKVGPPLTGFGERQIIAGEVANNPGNLIRWIMDPKSIEPG